MAQLILLRHGQSVWNKKNIFTGWVDVPLSKQGVEEAVTAGKQLATTSIDTFFCSNLIRAQHTALIAWTEHDSDKTPIMIKNDETLEQKCEAFDDKIIPVFVDERLNERHYGDLQGLNKEATRKKYGNEQVKIWRRSFSSPPPNGESLQMTSERTIPCLVERIIPELEHGNNCLVSAHGNSLRSIVMHIENLTEDEVISLEIGTGTPILYEYKNESWSKR